MQTFKTLTVRAEGAVGFISLNRPEKMNAMTLDMWAEVPLAIRAIEDELDDIRVIVLRGEGPHFCAGMDLSVFASLANTGDGAATRMRLKMQEQIRWFQHTGNSIAEARVPVIAAVQGVCLGGALAMVTACDLRYCTRDAIFSIEETNIGLTCDVGSLQRLRHIINDGRLREWAYTGQHLDSARALEWGLVSEVVDDVAALNEKVLAVAREIAGKSPLAIHGCKHSINFNQGRTVAAGLEQIAVWNGAMLDADDVLSAIEARQNRQQAEFPALQKPGFNDKDFQ